MWRVSKMSGGKNKDKTNGKKSSEGMLRLIFVLFLVKQARNVLILRVLMSKLVFVSGISLSGTKYSSFILLSKDSNLLSVRE